MMIAECMIIKYDYTRRDTYIYSRQVLLEHCHKWTNILLLSPYLCSLSLLFGAVLFW
uniref:Uncharacterized protein n=1 Tax=Anguilla anguilla TaxID=7936 RepID=A0A0E9V050_ANGAN